MLYNKITPGFVIQFFNNDGNCIHQEFVAGDDVKYETDEGDAINFDDMPRGGREYFRFDMVQP